MKVEIKVVRSKKDLKNFILFNQQLYQNNAFAVPELYEDVLNTLNTEKNPAFDFCEAIYFLAYQGNNLVGRVAGIINHKANKTWQKKEVRFGWIDFIDDIQVTEALLKAVENWGKEKGMTTLVGPLGFTDFDREGMLIEGFDQLSTMATIYNYPYYPKHLEQLGFKKATDWIEMKIQIPKQIPEKFARIAEIVQQKTNVRVRKIKSKKEILKTGLAHNIFRLLNEAYAPLFGFSSLSEKQIDLYVKMYVPILDLRMVSLLETTEGELVGVGISMPSLSTALQKAKGKLFPFGWFYLLKSLKWQKPKVLDLLLVAIKPAYQNKGLNALLFTDLIPIYSQMGFVYAESNPELEMNEKVQSQWQHLQTEQHKRRRCFEKTI